MVSLAAVQYSDCWRSFEMARISTGHMIMPTVKVGFETGILFLPQSKALASRRAIKVASVPEG